MTKSKIRSKPKNSNSINDIIKAIKKYDNFLITAHVNPEADALGSQLALYELVKKIGKNAVCVNNDKVPLHFKFLPGVENIKRTLPNGRKISAAIILDCPTLNRIGSVKKYLKEPQAIINIDHHISNNKFGDINWVKSSASSAGEMVYLLYKKMNIKISKKAALYIYIAILTDTGSFNYSNTSGVTHEIVSDLLGYGLMPGDISSRIYENKSYADIKLLGEALTNLKLEKNGEIAYIVCTRDMLKKWGSVIPNTENFINFAKSIKGVKIAIFIKEDFKKKGLFNISLRSKENINVNKLASFFGGGGHKKAAGCAMKGTLKSVKKKIIEKAKKYITLA